jgi:excisionase family DNA binding protein
MDKPTAPAPFAITFPPEFYDYLDQRIKEAVDAAIAEVQSKPKYYTRKEVCSLFAISLPTLDRYIKRGLLKGQKIGTRILFGEADLQKCLRDLKKRPE